MWASLILGLAQMGYGAYKTSQAKKAYNSISDAPYDISSLYADNVGLSESRAQTGWSADATNFYTNQLQQGLQSSNSAMLQAGGGINDFAKSYSNFTNGIKSFALEGDQMKSKNIAQLISDRSALAREQTQQWAINKYKKMQDQKAAAALMLQNYQSMTNSGMNTALQGASQLGSYYMQSNVPSGAKSAAPQSNTAEDALNNYFVQVQPTPSTTAASTTDYLQGGLTDYSKFFNQNIWGNPQQ